MPTRHRTLRLAALAVVLGACVALAGCGSSGDPVALLRQTFCGKHAVNSGNLDVALTIVPSGSRTIKGPLSLSLSGPFERQSSGGLPKSDFTIAARLEGSSVSVGIVSTGTAGYVTLGGASYQLPQASYQRLESGFSQFATPPGCGSNSSVLSRLHIRPLHWLSGPQVVGTENVGGVATTHIHSGIDIKAFLGDLGTFLKNSSSLGLQGGSSGLSSATLDAVAGDIQTSSFDVWTGQADKTLRRLRIHLGLAVTGQISTLLGGLRSAGIDLSLGYADLNRPQTITAPTNLHPYSEFQAQLAELVAGLRTALGSALGGGLSSGAGGGGSSTTGSTGGAYQAYSQCIQAAGGDVTKMQRCAPLLNGGQ